jgi:S-formylglutathione hydrolase FrmB
VVDSFAAAHHGNAPVLVFVDSGGGFNTDTECVDGSRGNAATHLTRDVVPFMTSHFGVSTLPANWGIVGFSAGGTCAVDLTVMHSDVFGSFVDIAGDIGPNSGTKAQTVDRLFGGSIEAWKGFDPVTVMARHGHYHGVSGVFIISGGAFDARGQVVGANNDEGNAARTLCSAATANGIQCSIEVRAGKHDWPFAGRAFAAALPWMAARIGIPQADVSPGPPLPAAASAAIQASPRSGGR